TTPSSGGLIAAQRQFAGHSPLLIIRYDHFQKYMFLVLSSFLFGLSNELCFLNSFPVYVTW
ncbi:hypothetical protein A2U01_0077765, partial [Trifolium medium]|nr:hypothetical protein [Trifolium medium]